LYKHFLDTCLPSWHLSPPHGVPVDLTSLIMHQLSHISRPKHISPSNNTVQKAQIINYIIWTEIHLLVDCILETKLVIVTGEIQLWCLLKFNNNYYVLYNYMWLRSSQRWVISMSGSANISTRKCEYFIKELIEYLCVAQYLQHEGSA
jgi:hypothetical protein